MKRLLLPASAFVLVLSACGAGHPSAPQVTNDLVIRLHGQPSVKAMAAAREREARRKAGRLLRRVVVPPGTIRLSHAPAGNGDLSHSWLGTSVITMTADRYSFWRSHESMASVIRFAEKHPVPGLKWAGSGIAPGEFQTVQFSGRGDSLTQRTVSVTAVGGGRWTYIRVDAGTPWIYSRSPREVVPAGVREIDIRDERISRRVTNRAQVERIVRWLDGLNVVQPGPAVHCKAVFASHLRLVFRAASGERLASALVPSQPADNCDPIEFSIRGKKQTPLIDASFGRRSFANRLQRLLGVRFPNR